MSPRIIAVATAVAFSAPTLALAKPAPQAPQPAQQALVQMLQEAQGREAQALVEVYTLQAQVTELRQRINDLQGTADARKAEPKPEAPPPADLAQ